MRYIVGAETYSGGRVWGYIMPHSEGIYNSKYEYFTIRDRHGDFTCTYIMPYREDGPAVIKFNGNKFYYFEGNRYNTIEEWLEVIPTEWKIKALYNSDNF